MSDHLIWLAIGLGIGVAIFLIFCAILAKLASSKEPDDGYDGDIFINKEGEMYAQFGIPIETIQKSRSVRMKIHYVKSKKGE